MFGKKKGLFAWLLSAALVLTTAAVPPVCSASEVAAGITFDRSTDTAYELKNNAKLTEGRDGMALYLDGTGAYASVDSRKINGIFGDFTVSVWCRPENTKDWTRIYDLGSKTDKYIFLSIFGNGCTRFVMKNGGNEQVLQGSIPLKLNEWNNVIVTRRAGVTVMYVNGAVSGSTAGIDLSPLNLGETSDNYLGKSQYSPDPYFKGMIDSFAVYSRALTRDEVLEIADSEYYLRRKTCYDRYSIAVNFLDSPQGTKIFQLDSKINRLTANVVIENLMKTDGKISLKMYSFKGSERTELGSIKNLELKSGINANLSLTADVPQDFDYISVYTKDEILNTEYECGRIAKSDIEFPAPVSTSTVEEKFGAHDPSIFKDPVSGKYYAYSSHNLVFESADLINWTKHDYTRSVTVPKSAADFIDNSGAYTDTEANKTYWAPDVIYVGDDEYPYWCYVSVSCGLGGRNSVICLLKCKSPGIWDGETKDCGVVIASVENDNYKTNAIDSNIYTDTDGKMYFIWGSFWQGIHAAPLNSDGTVAGIDCFASGAADDANNAVMIEKSKNFGKPIMSVKDGTVGPEGPWLISNPELGYRYLFTSYGWLGTNYNIRLSRSSLDASMENIIKSSSTDAFTDENNNKVAEGYTKGSDKEDWGYKLIGSYRLGDGITYCGNGHNSVLNDNGEWYLVDHVRKVADAAAYLQVRKLLWTKSGWPVVSPLGYTGEKIQPLNETILYGTWDLASVGVTLTESGAMTHKGSDLPVESCRITLMPDGSLADGLGTWEFDGDHTVTITFSADGDKEKNEYYKANDVMTMLALTGYDEDKAEHAVVMTGTDQNNVTQFAKKNNAGVADTRPFPADTKETAVPKSTGGNPVLGFDGSGNILYAGDPAATVIGDTVYLYAGHDTADGDGYKMPEWVLYTSKDMSNWEYKGSVMKAADISWRNDDTSAWAAQVIEHKGKYYMYFCTWTKTDSGKQSIGVAVSDSPEGPFTDKGTPLVKGSVTTPQTSDWNDIDPTVWIDTDENGTEHRYLAWGNGKYYVCELNDDMMSVTDKNNDGKIDMNDISEQTINNTNGAVFTEAPWLYKRGDMYYTFFAANWREEMAYATASSPYGPWEYKGNLMPPTATSNTNHPSVIDFNGKTYFIYHNGALPNGSGHRRSICVEELSFDSDGNVLPLAETSTGIGGSVNTIISYNSKFVSHEDFVNPSADNAYPLKMYVIPKDSEDGMNSSWEIVKGKYEPNNEAYISIQSENKPGLYLAAVDGDLILTADPGNMAENMTFKTVEGLNGKGVSFESVSEPGKYITEIGNSVTLAYMRDANACTFYIREKGYTPKPPVINSVTNGNISISMEENGAYDVYAVKYQDNGSLDKVKVFANLKIGENSLSADFEPDKVLVWTKQCFPCAAWTARDGGAE